MNNRVLFLDYDGVVNTPMWNNDGTICSYNFPSHCKVNNFQAVQWISEFCQKCGFDIVVTSTWRLHKNYKECLINGGLRKDITILGKTPDMRDKSRGEEIQKYLDEHKEIDIYIIADDESEDMLSSQLSHLIVTNGDVGFTESDFQKAEEIYESLKKDLLI